MKYTERLFPDLSQVSGSTRPSTEGGKKRSLPFKAPSRVENNVKHASASSKSSVKTAKPTAKAKAPAKTSTAKAQSNAPKKTTKAAVVLSSDDDSDELDDTPPAKKQRRRAESDEDDDEDEQEDEESDSEPQPVRKPAARPKDSEDAPPIPAKLLTRLLYEGFEDKNMKIGREAMIVVGKYMETFVREALARAVFEREEADAELGKETGDGFLQVEDLEKLAPQLLLDF